MGTVLTDTLRFVGADNGIYEFKVNQRSLMLFPSVTRR